jgi:hypothetical protein
LGLKKDQGQLIGLVPTDGNSSLELHLTKEHSGRSSLDDLVALPGPEKVQYLPQNGFIAEASTNKKCFRTGKKLQKKSTWARFERALPKEQDF